MEKEVSRKHMIEVDTGFEETKSEDVRMTRCLHDLVRDHPDFEVLCETALDPYHFRYVPHTLAERQEEPEIQRLLDRLNEEIVEGVQRSGLNLVTTTRVRSRVAIRIAISSNRTIDTTFEAIARRGRLLYKSQPLSYQTTPDRETESCLNELDSSLTEVSAT